MSNTRRDFLRKSTAATAAFASGGWLSTESHAEPVNAGISTTPLFTLSVNLELMFPKAMPWEERLEIAGREGAKAYSFWAFANKDLDKLRAVQDRYGMACASITGANKTGWKGGLTKTGEEKAFLDDFSEACAAAKKVGAQNLITFVGITQPDIPWETQMEQVIAGLKKAGDIAGEAGVFLTLEPLNAVESPQMAMVTSGRAYEIVERVAHPRVKVDFDLYHRQLGEGNLLNTLKKGIAKGYVTFVEVGDVPGRFEPGTGEVDYARIFRTLNEVGYKGYVGMEHRASKTAQEAIRAVYILAGAPLAAVKASA